MCIAVFSFTPNSSKPLILGFNRDEVYNRKSLAPDYHWNDDTFLAPLDIKEKGSWLGINIFGLVVCILNKEVNLDKTQHNFLSRGVLVTTILKCKNVKEALILIKHKNLTFFRPFSVLIFDKLKGVIVSNYQDLSKPILNIKKIKPGIHLISKTYLDDIKLPRIKNNISQSKNIDFNDTNSLISLMQSEFSETNSSMIQNTEKWGTVSTTIIQLNQNYVQLKYKSTDMKSFVNYKMKIKDI